MTDWTTRELATLLELQAEGVPHERIAQVLQRSVPAVKGQLRRQRVLGNDVTRRRIPLHGLDLSAAHPVVRQVLSHAIREGFTYDVLSRTTGYARGTITKMLENPTLRTVDDVARRVGLRLKVEVVDG